MSRNALEVALSLAAHGWHVFPVRMPDKRPLVLWGDAATIDPETIATWWGIDYPEAAIGVHMGKSGLVGVDVDTKGCDNKRHPADCEGNGWEALEAADIKAPSTFRYETPSGGSHLIYPAPEGRTLTIAQDVPVRHVDLRAGHGFLIYYGDVLKKAPKLKAPPEWALIDTEAKPADRAPTGDEAAYRDRLVPGKPDKAVKAALREVKPKGMSHADMLEAVTSLVQLGQRGHRGVDTALDVARETYTHDWPDAERHWDNAVAGSIKRIGLPPLTLELTKAERKVIAERNAPKAVAAAETGRKADYVAKKIELGEGQLTDAALAEHIADELAGDWANAKGQLLRYDGRVWEPGDEPALVETVRRKLRVIRADETRNAILRGDKRHQDEAKLLEGRGRIVAIARLAAGIMAERTPTPDSHPDLLNTPTGVVDLRTGELLPHDHRLMFTKMTAATYDPDADATLWHKALEALPGKVRPWVQVRLGQALTGYTPDDAVMPIFEGSGENGKSTIFDAIREAAGSYAVTVSKRLLMANPGDHPTELTDLMGARIAFAEELPDGRNLDVSRLKDVVGTSTLTARRMRQDNVTWRATHAIFVNTNYRLAVAETDHGTWRRLALVLFPYRYLKPGTPLKTERDRRGDPRLKPYFESNADPAVLAWLVAGARAWYANGKTMPEPPKRVVRDTFDWRTEADPVLSYVRDRLELSAEHAIAATDLTNDFNAYLEQRSSRPWSESTIASRFRDHIALPGVTKRQVRFGAIRPSRPLTALRPLPAGTKAWVGVRFKTDDDAIRIPSQAEQDARVLSDLERRMQG